MSQGVWGSAAPPQLNHDADQIQQTVGCAQDLFKDKPESALGLIKSSLAMSIKASQQMSTYESMQAQQLAAHTRSKNDEFFDNTSRRFAALREQERSFSLSQAMPAGTSVPLTSLTNEQIASIAVPPQSSSSSSSTFDRRYIDAGRQQQQQQQQQQLMRQEVAAEKPAAPMFVRASETDPGTNDYDARGQFEQQKKLFGRIPSIRDVSFGVKVEHTGEMKASASGEKVPVTRVVPLRQSPAVVEPANFAPEWNAVLERAMQARQNSGVRYLGRDIVRQTFQGSGYNA